MPEKAQTPEYGWYAREKNLATWHPMTDYTNGVDNAVDDWALTLGCGPGNADLSTCHVDYSAEPAKTRQTGHKMNILTNTTIGTVGVSRVNEIDEPYDEICGADTGGSRHWDQVTSGHSKSNEGHFESKCNIIKINTEK